MPQGACYVIRSPEGLIYSVGSWVSQPPFEVFIPPPMVGVTTIGNIAAALGGELVELEELESEVKSGTTEGNGPTDQSASSH